MTTLRPAFLVLAVGLCVAAPALADSLHAAQSAAPSAPSAARWILARQKPNGSGVQVRYVAPAALRIGYPDVVRLQLSGVTAAGASVELRSSEADLRFEVVGVPAPRPLELRTGEVRSLEVRVTAASEGLQYLNVFTTQHGRPSVTAVPLHVGNVSAHPKPAGSVQTTPSGERIISLPASR